MVRAGNCLGEPRPQPLRVLSSSTLIDGLVAEQQHQDGQANGRLGRRHRQNEEHENLAVQIAQVVGEGHEVHVDRQQHQLDGHQQNNQILSVQENADHRQREQNRAQRQEVTQCQAHALASSAALRRQRARLLSGVHGQHHQTIAGANLHLHAGVDCLAVLALAQRERNGRDHRHQQDHRSHLDRIEVFGVEQQTQRLGVGHIGHGSGRHRCGHVREPDPQHGDDLGAPPPHPARRRAGNASRKPSDRRRA